MNSDQTQFPFRSPVLQLIAVATWKWPDTDVVWVASVNVALMNPSKWVGAVSESNFPIRVMLIDTLEAGSKAWAEAAGLVIEAVIWKSPKFASRRLRVPPVKGVLVTPQEAAEM